MRNHAPNCKTAFKTSKSITELDGVWIMIPTLNLKKKRKKEIAGFKPSLDKPLPVLSVSNLFLTLIYWPGKRCNWNRITVVPLLPTSIVKYWVTTNVQSTLSHLDQNNKFRHVVYTTRMAQSSVSFPALKWLCFSGYIAFFFQVMLPAQVKISLLISLFFNEYWLPGYNFKQV